MEIIHLNTRECVETAHHTQSRQKQNEKQQNHKKKRKKHNKNRIVTSCALHFLAWRAVTRETRPEEKKTNRNWAIHFLFGLALCLFY